MYVRGMPSLAPCIKQNAVYVSTLFEFLKASLQEKKSCQFFMTHFSYNTTVTGSEPKRLRSISPLQPGWWPDYEATRSVKLNACDGVYLCNYVDMSSIVISMH